MIKFLVQLFWYYIDITSLEFMKSLELVSSDSNKYYDLSESQIYDSDCESYKNVEYFDKIEDIAVWISNNMEDFYNPNSNLRLTEIIDKFLVKCLEIIDDFRESEFEVSEEFFKDSFLNIQKLTRKELLTTLTNNISK